MKPPPAIHSPDIETVSYWRLDARPEELTEIVLDPESIHFWCPMELMDSEVVERGRPDGLGMTIKVFTKGFLPYHLFLIAKIVDLVPHRFMAIAVQGDFEGLAHMSVEPVDERICEAKFHWRTDIHHPWFRHFKRVLRPVFLWNHKWAMRRCRRLMQQEVYRRRNRSDRFSTARPTFPHNVRASQKLIRRRGSPPSWDETRSLENL